MSISKEIMLEMYKRMDQVRKFEEKVSEFFAKGMIHGTTHLSIGQEASGVPAVMALEDGDLVTLTHRGHAMSIGMGIDLNKMMAELMGKATGFCKGKGGSMHIVDVDSGNLGSNGVVGGGLTLAPGAALTQKYKKTGKIVLCSFGDGASNEGSFHEGVNLSSVWKLPVIFYCENNLYGMSTPHTKVMNVKNVADRASSYGIQSFIVDGYDAVAVYETVKNFVENNFEGGKSVTYGLKEGAVGIPDTTSKLVPEDILKYVADETTKLENGDIVAPKTEEEYNEFIKSL